MLPDLLEGYFPGDEYCDLRGISKRQAQRERASGEGPPWLRLGRDIYYSRPGFREWLAAREVRAARPENRGRFFGHRRKGPPQCAPAGGV